MEIFFTVTLDMYRMLQAVERESTDDTLTQETVSFFSSIQ